MQFYHSIRPFPFPAEENRSRFFGTQAMTRIVNYQSAIFWGFEVAEIWCASRLLVLTITYESREFLCDSSETFISNRRTL